VRGPRKREGFVQAIIMLIDAKTKEISDYYTLAPPEGQTLIVFSDESKVEEVRAAVSSWAAKDGLAAGKMEMLEAETFDDAQQAVLLMSPHMSEVRFIPDSDPLVDSLLAYIRE